MLRNRLFSAGLTFLFVASAILPVAARTVARPALIVLNKSDNELVVVDLNTKKITGRVPVGLGPHEVVTTPDGATAFVANYGDGPNPGSSISVVDLNTLKEIRRVDTKPLFRPHGLAFAAGRLYFTSETSRVIGSYDPAANVVDWIVGTGQAGTHMIMAKADGRAFYTTNIGGHSVSVIERVANPIQANVTTIPTGRGPEGFDISPDGKELWAAHSQDGGLSIIDPATKAVVATIDIKTGRSNRLKFTPDGARVLISDINNNHLVVMDVKTRAVTQRIPTGQTPLGILMDPDGTRAFVAFSVDNTIGILDLKTLTFGEKIATGAVPDGMAIIK